MFGTKKKGQTYLISLQLEQKNDLVDGIEKNLKDFGIFMDKRYGVVTISPKSNLYAIRVTGNIENFDKARAVSPRIKELYYDLPVTSASMRINNANITGEFMF